MTATGDSDKQTLAEQLDATQDGQQFADVLMRLFNTLERIHDDDD